MTTEFHKTYTRSPNKAENLDNTSGIFFRDKVVKSEPSDILLLISRKILSTLLQRKKSHMSALINENFLWIGKKPTIRNS